MTKTRFLLKLFPTNFQNRLNVITAAATSIATTETGTSIGIGEAAEIETDRTEMKEKGAAAETEVLKRKRLVV